MGRMIVLANAVEGRDAEYNEWYNTTHIPEVLAAGPFTAVQRFKMADAQMGEVSDGYVAIYEFDGPAAEALAALGAAAAGFTPSEASASNATIYFAEDLAPRVTE
jgi:hypothetical protein